MTMLCDIMLLFFDRRRPKYWCFAATIILTLDGISIAVVVAKEVIEWNEVDQTGFALTIPTGGDTGVPDLTTNLDDTHRREHSNNRGSGPEMYKRIPFGY
jgi:hypothetical protein